MDAELDPKRVVINPNAIMKRQLPQLRLGTSSRQPTIEHAFLQQILDPPHRRVPLLLHRLVEVRRHEDPGPDAPPAEQPALHHKVEHPVPVVDVVAVEGRPELPRIELGGGLGGLRRGVAEAEGGAHCGGGRQGGGLEVAQEDGRSPVGAVGGLRCHSRRLAAAGIVRRMAQTTAGVGLGLEV